MHKTTLSNKMFDMLSAHIAEIDREKDGIIKKFYSDNAGTGMDIETFFREYISTIENYLKSANIQKDIADKCPLAIIGSTVEVRDTNDSEIMSFEIILPYSNKPVNNMNQASCLSPMGKALLLKTAGSSIAVKTPAGLLNYEILSISLPMDSVEKNSISQLSF